MHNTFQPYEKYQLLGSDVFTIKRLVAKDRNDFYLCVVITLYSEIAKNKGL